MAQTGRRTTVHNGQLPREFRSRDTSGFHLTPDPRLAALIHDIGQPCWAFGPTAAALHRFDGFDLKPPFHVVTPRDRNVRRLGHVVHTAFDLPRIDRSLAFDLPVTSPARTLIDLAKSHGAERLTTALDGALRDGLISEDFLLRRICALRASGRYGIPNLLAVIEGSEISRGAHSWLEREFLRLMSVAGLPRPLPQQVLSRRGDTLIRVDFRFAGTPVVVEVLGYRWHRTRTQMIVDAQRYNRLILDGFVPLQFTFDAVVSDSDTVVRTVLEALADPVHSVHQRLRERANPQSR